MNNKEKILKYLADLLSQKEKEEFELLLESDESLKSDFEKIKSKLNSLKDDSKPEVNEVYFVNLLPRARAKLGERKSFTVFKLNWVSYFAAFLFMIASVFFFENSFENKFLTYKEIENVLNGGELTELEKTNIDLFIDESYYDLVSFNDNNLDLDLNSIKLHPEDIKQVEITDDQLDATYDYLNNLSDKELEKFYEDLKKINLQ